MKIGQPTDSQLLSTQSASAAPSKAAQGASAQAKTNASKSTQSAGVAVTVSTLARTLEASGLSDAADIDTAKVEAVRSAIEQGTYVVNPEAIADKLLSNAQEMLRPVRN